MLIVKYLTFHAYILINLYPFNLHNKKLIVHYVTIGL